MTTIHECNYKHTGGQINARVRIYEHFEIIPLENGKYKIVNASDKSFFAICNDIEAAQNHPLATGFDNQKRFGNHKGWGAY